MKYLLILFTSLVFSQKSTYIDTVYINFSKLTDKVSCEGCEKSECPIIKLTLRNVRNYDSLVFYLKKIPKFKINRVNIIGINDFAEKLNFNLLKNLHKQNIYFIYDKKQFYTIDAIIIHERTQE
jgi:hypothetical protein